MKIVHPNSALVPVPIGPALPRRDQPDIYARYCRLMLLMFIPWRKSSDLRQNTESWIDVYERARQHMSEYHSRLIDNMQLLHECKDCRDDHFRNRQHRHRVLPVVEDRTHPQGDELNVMPEADILDHLQSLDRSSGVRKSLTDTNVLGCVLNANKCDLFMHCIEKPDDMLVDGSEYCLAINAPLTEEDSWQAAYAKRKERWKRSLMAPHNQETDTVSD